MNFQTPTDNSYRLIKLIQQSPFSPDNNFYFLADVCGCVADFVIFSLVGANKFKLPLLYAS